MNTDPNLSNAAAALGRKGGKATGATKLRGSSEYYKELARKAADARKARKTYVGSVVRVFDLGFPKARYRWSAFLIKDRNSYEVASGLETGRRRAQVALSTTLKALRETIPNPPTNNAP